ncbi:PREDICTED: inorganic pyrophosphatase 2-like [Tarenaya hassleriana]|uniref:inorganic pyrophosphatase 2-like n=1 Tax=Tarenaya hassleriana TaxID=28532 RepID=UPI00053C13CF|nr:PREDICTED: inorganic pyrophosphatase 2-like [Tarenaya hassleriana]
MAEINDRRKDIVVIFDFDKTIIDVDSDNWVLDELGFTDLFNQLLPSMPWNSLMDRMMEELRDEDVTIDDVKRVLRTIPIHPRVVPAIKSAHALGCELRIVSDANMFFIETVLEHLGIKDLFSEINTNPGFIDEHGRLRISPYHDFTKSSHGCSRCPPNMCKALVIEKIQDSLSKEAEKKKKIIYLGDGAGDYCPALKLDDVDYMMPRKNYPVWDLISENTMLISAKIREWIDGETLEKVLVEIIEEIHTEDEEEEKILASENCKITVGNVHEALSHALPVQVRQH